MKVGDKLKTWFSGSEDGISRIIEIMPYHGAYPQFFDCVLKLSAQTTKRGWMEMAYNSKDWKHDSI